MSVNSSQRPMSVLLVDDDDDFRNVITRQLVKMGYVVQPVATSSDFLARLMSDRDIFDFLIVDIRLPGLNGDQLVRWLRNSENEGIRDMPVLFVTGHASEVHYLPRTRPSTFVLLKPYSSKDLENAIASLVSDI